MPAQRVVPRLDPGKDCQACLGFGLPGTPVNQLTLQGGEETLRHGVVVSVAHRSHGWLHTQSPCIVYQTPGWCIGCPGLNGELY